MWREHLTVKQLVSAEEPMFGSDAATHDTSHNLTRRICPRCLTRPLFWLLLILLVGDCLLLVLVRGNPQWNRWIYVFQMDTRDSHLFLSLGAERRRLPGRSGRRRRAVFTG